MDFGRLLGIVPEAIVVSVLVFNQRFQNQRFQRMLAPPRGRKAST
jgi:hypothetical protein